MPGDALTFLELYDLGFTGLQSSLIVLDELCLMLFHDLTQINDALVSFRQLLQFLVTQAMRRC